MVIMGRKSVISGQLNNTISSLYRANIRAMIMPQVIKLLKHTTISACPMKNAHGT